MYSAEQEQKPLCTTSIDRDLEAYLHDAAIPTARVARVYDMAHGRRKSIDKLLEHALKSRHTMPAESLDDYCIFVNVHPDHDFSTHFRYEYDANRSILIFTVPAKFVHNVAANLLSTELMMGLNSIRVSTEVLAIGGCEIEIGPGLKKAPDGAWRPLDTEGKPTMVAEVGMTDSKPKHSKSKLQRDANYWLSNATYQPIVITLNIFAKTGRFVLTSWVKRDGAVEMESEMTYQDKGEGAVSIKGDPICVSFSRLLGRAPRPPLEQDLIFGENFLRHLMTALKTEPAFRHASGLSR